MTAAVLEIDAHNCITVLMDGDTRILDVKADTASGDMDEDMANVAGTLAWYTQVLAAAREHCDMAEAGYRHWQAQLLREYLEDDPRIAEWKAKAAQAAEPDYMAWKTKVAEAWRLANRLDGAVKALTVKADMLRSRGAMVRTEITHLSRDISGPAVDGIESKGQRLKNTLNP